MIRRSSSRTAVLCGVLALLSALSACSAGLPGATRGDTSTAASAGGSSDATGQSPTPPPAPATDRCRNLAFADVGSYSNATRTLPCSKPHTAYTFSVVGLPSDIAFSGVQIQNQAVQDAAATRCRNSFARYIGGTAPDRALSRLSVTYFLPAQRGFDLGAHWVRCDVIAFQSPQVLARLPRTLHHLLDRPANVETYAVCSNGKPGTAPAKLVMCTQGHDYRAIAALPLGGPNATYPGLSVTRGQGQRRCRDRVANRLGRGGGYSYSWTYPSRHDWTMSGQRFGYCWLRSRR